MSRLLFLFCLVFSAVGYSANTPNGPVTKKTDGTNAINEDLVFGAGRTLNLANGAVVWPTSGVPWANVAKTGSSLADLAARDYAALQNKPALGDSAAKNVGTTTGTVAAGDDTRIVGAAQKSANLSDVANAATAFANIKQAATTSATGVVQLATVPETVTGTDNGKGTTSAGVRAALSSYVDPIANSRPPRQGLNFDGAAGATLVLSSALGSAGFTIDFVAKFTYGTSRALLDNNGLLLFFIYDNGMLRIYDRVASSYIYTSAAGFIPDKKTFRLTYVRGALYINGLAAGAAITDTSTYTATTVYVGRSLTGDYWLGPLSLGVANRSLTAAEVLTLNETGQWPADCSPATPAGTVLNTSTFIDGSYGGGFSGASSTGFTAALNGTGYALSAPYRAARVGDQYRVIGTLTLNGGKTVLPTVEFASTAVALTAGAFSVNLTVSTASAGTALVIRSTGDANYTLENVAYYPLGAVCAPDPQQPGLGPQWRGYGAPINLPGDGVSGGVTWAVAGGQRTIISGTMTAAGYLLGRDGLHIPPECIIDSIYASGNGTWSLGGSGSDLTSIVNAQTVTSTAGPVTLAGRTTSTSKLYGSLGTATTVTYTITLCDCLDLVDRGPSYS